MVRPRLNGVNHAQRNSAQESGERNGFVLMGWVIEWVSRLFARSGPVVLMEPWDNVFSSIAEDILKIKNKGVADG